MGNALSCCNRPSSPSLYHASRLHKYETSSNSSRRASALHEQHHRRRSTASPTTSGFIDGQDYNSLPQAQSQHADYYPAVLNDAGHQQITHYRRKPSTELISSGYSEFNGENALARAHTVTSGGGFRQSANAGHHQPYSFQYINNTRPPVNNVVGFHQNLGHQQQYFDTDEEGYVSENRTPILAGLHHISEREPGDGGDDPSSHPTLGPMFKRRSRMCLDKLAGASDKMRKRRSAYYLNSTGTPSEASLSGRMLRKFNSCSTIYVDDSTISQPNLRSTLKCVALAIYFHIQQREHAVPSTLDIFDERLHPITRDSLPADHWERSPEHRHIYRFLRLLFHAAQLTAEVAIITLVYLERLLTYAELDIASASWKRMVLGSVMLASKVWDDQAVWNVDYCQILREVDVDDMNELERTYLEALQFNINIPASVYAKYYFHLRDLADEHPDLAPIKWEAAAEPLRLDRAVKLEALSRLKSVTLYAAASSSAQQKAAGDAPTKTSKQPPQHHSTVMDQMLKTGGQPGVDPSIAHDDGANAVDVNGTTNGGDAAILYVALRRMRSNSVDNSAAQQNRRSIAILS